ncbi:NAD(P)/FAD-dependent oxidoreductase [Clostridium sp. BNL1100]|uniref:NAD(P)/FAD-dependent oxidoreductase n=1 Tax=Clostridium sp. BNL1100 TaxID=755731 RepID=UPI00024A7A77|nr:NAD(P)/FAD-dependent oxidoreductase [Clostridium sp. BNL1100]AEY66141.1 thioredoxin reductase [Clostridium sp. BNL1100]
MIYDVIIVGKGPAGLSAAIYTVRANLKTLVIGQSNSGLFKASKIENYFGFSEAVSGSDLLKAGELQARRLGADITDEEVLGINKTDNFEVITHEKSYYAKTVLLASGQPQKKLEIDGLKEMEGIGVSYCTTCDGFFYRGLKVGVLGNKDFAIHEAEELKAFANDITIYTNGMELEYKGDYNKLHENFRIVNKSIQKLNGKDCLESIYFTDGSFEKLDGLFVANDIASGIDFAKRLGVLTKGASIVVDENQKTNIEGLYAAGDCTGGFKQIATAVGQGALAAGRITEFIRRAELINI